jgi:hypothetical protein
LNICRHSIPGKGHGLCVLESSRVLSDDGRKALIFHGRTDFTPVECDIRLFKICPFKTNKDGKPVSSRGTVKCEHCGKAHVPGSLNSKMCKEWASFKSAYQEIRREMPGKRKFFLTGTKEEVYSDDCDEFLRRRLWNKVKITILRRDQFTCQDCGRSYKDIARGKNKRSGLEVHHIIPRSLGGTDHPGNLKTVCMECHRVYTNSTIGLMKDVRLEEKLSERNCGRDEDVIEPETDEEVDDMAFD